MKKFLSLSVSAAAAALVTGCSSVCPFAGEQEMTYKKEIVGVKPTLFVELGETFSVPDALAIDSNNNLVLSVPNYRTFDKHGAKMVTLNKEGKIINTFNKLPLESTTKSVHPMGIAFGPDGNLYIADNQCFGVGIGSKWQTDKSRILRLNYKNGKPTTCDVVVTGLGVSNAVRWHGDNLYLTDSIIPNMGTNGDMSGVYRFSLEEMSKGKPVVANNDKHLLVKSKGEEKGFGADGMVFDAEGNMYYGHFSGGQFFKVTFNCDESVASHERIMNSPAFECCDGIIYDKDTNSIYITNSMMNSIWIYDITANTMQRLWENADDDGKTGLIDQPCEPILWDGDLYVVNFDWTFPHLRNRVSDDVNTISKFDLK